ncbi:general secretion pathway protein I [Silvimonas terrae]|uniref:Type II secretion system protein I n=1 Tax=Silvimonas terrae TaxID=300266 RepID=A0A840RCS9_9NEIS|nr:type II secretion system minor pseudopilin GspI [Silvimonas terrae]MBB5190384.1 general secretion pathway protein I [Silvimonas terrae]
MPEPRVSVMRQRAFTLIEVMVALAVVAIALMAALKATSFATDSAMDFRTRMLAGWVAENRLAELTARRDFPETGQSSGNEDQAGETFIWRINVGPSPNRSFRRLEITVYEQKDQQHAAATLVSYLARVQ